MEMKGRVYASCVRSSMIDIDKDYVHGRSKWRRNVNGML